MKKILFFLIVLTTFGCKGEPAEQAAPTPSPQRIAEIAAEKKAERIQQCLQQIVVINDHMDYIPYKGCMNFFEASQPSLPEILLAHQADKKIKIVSVMLDWYGDVNYSTVNGYVVTH